MRGTRVTDVQKTRRRLWLRLADVAVAVLYLMNFRVSVALAGDEDWGGIFPFSSIQNFSSLDKLPDEMRLLQQTDTWSGWKSGDRKKCELFVAGQLEKSPLRHFFPDKNGFYIYGISEVGKRPSEDGGQYRGGSRLFVQFEGEKNAHKLTMPITCNSDGRVIQIRLGEELNGEKDAKHTYFAGNFQTGVLGKRITEKKPCGHGHTTSIWWPPEFYRKNGLGEDSEVLRRDALRKLGYADSRWPLPLLTGCPLAIPARLPLPVVRPPGTTYPLTLVPPGPPPTFGKQWSRNAAYCTGAGLIGFALDSLVLKLLQSQAESGHVGAQQILESMEMQGKIISNAHRGLMPDGTAPKGLWDYILITGVTGYSVN